MALRTRAAGQPISASVCRMTDADDGITCAWPRRRVDDRDGVFDVMWARPGLTPFVVRVCGGDDLRLFGTAGLSAYLVAEGHDVICPIVREFQRSSERHRLDGAPAIQNRALWPSYIVVRWAGPPSQRVRRWFATKLVGWGMTGGQRWQAPAGLVDRWRGYVEDRTKTQPQYATGQAVDVVDGPWRGQRMVIKSSRKGKDGVWVYECDLPPMLTQIVSPVISEAHARPALTHARK
jgi:hypothetical protein